jgi:hypothetical protein
MHKFQTKVKSLICYMDLIGSLQEKLSDTKRNTTCCKSFKKKGNLNVTSHIIDDKYLVIATIKWLQCFIMCYPNFKFYILEKWTFIGRLLLNQSQVHIKPKNCPYRQRGENNVTWQIVLETQSSKMLGQGIPTIGTSFRRDK